MQIRKAWALTATFVLVGITGGASVSALTGAPIFGVEVTTPPKTVPPTTVAPVLLVKKVVVVTTVAEADAEVDDGTDVAPDDAAVTTG
jgi:hypothetical protein